VGDSVSIAFYQVKFVPQMPVKVDITVSGVSVSKTGQGAGLLCDESIPLSAGGPTERYKVTAFQGQIIGDSISFSLNFGTYPTSYHGKLSVN
jgi:aspartate oxidase